MSEKLNILYVCPDHTLGGSSRSLLDLISSVCLYVNPIVLLPSVGSAYDEFKKRDIETIVHPYIRLHQAPTLSNVLLHPWRAYIFRFFLYDLLSVRLVKKVLGGRKIDIVHSNYSPIYIGCLLAKILGAKHVWHVREYGNVVFQKQPPYRLKRRIIEADARIAISNAIKEYWDMPDKNTWVINNAIRSKEDACYIKPKNKYILFSSYVLTEAKGTRKAIAAFAMSGVCKQGYVLKLMGNVTEQYKESLMATIRENNIERSVEFVPCQQTVKPYFAHATAYIMASEYEGLGRVTAEAMFYGCPVIAHASGGTLDLIKHGETGYLFHTIDECAELIINVCATNQEELILRAQNFAINNLSLEEYGQKIMNVYNAIIRK